MGSKTFMRKKVFTLLDVTTKQHCRLYEHVEFCAIIELTKQRIENLNVGFHAYFIRPEILGCSTAIKFIEHFMRFI